MLNTPEYIDSYIKRGIDRLIDKLIKSGEYNFSDSTLLEIANLSNHFISRVTDIIITENLREIEDFSTITYH